MCTVCPVITAEPFFAPGSAPSDHHPITFGSDGGLSAPPLALIPITDADISSFGTTIRLGRPGAGFEGFDGFFVALFVGVLLGFGVLVFFLLVGGCCVDGGELTIDGSAATGRSVYSSQPPVAATASPTTPTSQPHLRRAGWSRRARRAPVMYSD